MAFLFFLTKTKKCTTLKKGTSMKEKNKNIDHKKDMILNCINLGIEKERAFVLAQCSEKETEKLEKDQTFLKEIEIHEIMLEEQLLVEHEKALQFAIAKGNTRPIEWKLSKINPERWGTTKEEKKTIESVLVLSEDDEKLL